MRHDAANASADDRPEDGARHLSDLVLAGLAGLGGAVTEQDVTHLVCHHADHLALAVGRLDHPAVHEHRPARQGKGVDLAYVHGFEGVLELVSLELGWDDGREPLTQPGHIRRDRIVAHDRQLLPGLGGCLQPEFDVLGGRVVVVRRRNARLASDADHRQGNDDHR